MTRSDILVLSAGRRVSLVRAFQRELGLRAPGARVHAADLDPTLSAACQVADVAHPVPRATDDDYADKVLDLALENSVGMVVPTIDTELLPLAHAKEKFAAAGVTLVVSDAALVEQCRDKRLTASLFGSFGISTPEEFGPGSTLPDPCFMKPARGSRSVGIRKFDLGADVPDDLRGDPEMIFMEYLDPAHHDEYTVDMYYDSTGTLRCAVPRKRLLVRDGEVNKALTVKGALSVELFRAMRFVDGAMGCLTSQFFVSATGRITGIEINPRFGGGYPLAYRAGANFPGWLIDEHILGVGAADSESWEDGMLMLRYDDEVIVSGARVGA